MANSILFGTDYDLQTKNGGLVIGNADGQQIVANMVVCEGQLRHAPYTGIGVRNSILAKGTPTAMMHRTQRKLKLDLATVNYVKFINNEIVADATWDV